MQYTENELNSLIQEVEKEFTTHLAKAEEEFKNSKLAKSEGGDSAATEVLAKAEDDKKPEAKDEKKEDAKPAEDKPAAEAKDAPPAAEGKEEAPKADAPPSDKPADAPPAAEGEQPAAAAAPAEDCDYDDEDHAHMHEMYSSMSKGELKAHHDAVRKALDAQGMQKCGDMHMAKSETEVSVEVKPEQIAPAPEAELLKSELQAKSAKVEELQKSVDAMSEFLNKLFTRKSAPAAKAITNLDVIAKSESAKEEVILSKGEITSILTKKAANPTLAKSDREAINAFYATGQVNVQSISHLLK